MRAGVGLSIPCPQIVTDEIRFIGLANDVAHGTWGHPFSRFRDYPFGMYSALIAPLVRAAPAGAYAAIKVFNAFLMASLCFPVWLLARRMLRRRAALAVALLSLCLPALGYASDVMAENLFYPLFLWVLELALRWRTSRSLRVGFLVAVTGAALALTKAQGWLVLGAIVALPMVPAFGGRARLRAAWALRFGAVVAVAGLASVVWAYVRFGGELWGHLGEPRTWLGYYAIYLHRPEPRQFAGELRLWGASLLGAGGELAPLVGIAWLAAAVDAAWRGRRRAARLLAPLTLVLWLAFTRDGIRLALYFDRGMRVHERYSACLAPLLLLLAAEALVRRGINRRSILAALAAGAIVAAFTLPPVISPHLVEESPGLSWLSGFAPKRAPLVLGAAGAAFAAAIWWVERPAALAGALAVGMLGTSAGMARAQRRLVAEDMGAHRELIPLAQRLAREGRRFVILTDGFEIHAVWNAEMFSNEGEGNELCFDDRSGFCARLDLDAQGQVSRLERLPPGTLVVTREPVLLDAPVWAREGAVWVYEMNGQAVRRLAAER